MTRAAGERPAASPSAQPQLLPQQRHRLTQLQSVSRGVEEQGSGLSNKARILEFSSCSRLFSRLSCSVSFSIRSLSLLTRKISFSIRCLSFLKACSRLSKSGSRRQLSIDKNCRHRGNDAKDSPLLLELDAGAEGGDVVIRSKQGDQAKDETSDGLGGAEAVEAGPGERC